MATIQFPANRIDKNTYEVFFQLKTLQMLNFYKPVYDNFLEIAARQVTLGKGAHYFKKKILKDNNYVKEEINLCFDASKGRAEFLSLKENKDSYKYFSEFSLYPKHEGILIFDYEIIFFDEDSAKLIKNNNVDYIMGVRSILNDRENEIGIKISEKIIKVFLKNKNLKNTFIENEI